MSEEPINPYYMYDNVDKKYLEDNLKSKTNEWKRYIDWAERVGKEIAYIKNKLSEK